MNKFLEVSILPPIFWRQQIGWSHSIVPPV